MNWTAADIDLVAESGRYHRDRRWDALTLRIWAAGIEVGSELDAAVERWADLLFSSRYLYSWPNPIVGGAPWVLPYTLDSISPPQIPRTPGLFRPPHGILIFDKPVDRSGWEPGRNAGPMSDPGGADPTEIGCTKDDASEVCFCDDVRECGNAYPRTVTNPATVTDALEAGQGPNGTLID